MEKKKVFYHILTVEQFHNHYDDPEYGKVQLLSNDFLHCCTKTQLSNVLKKHYGGESQVIALEIIEEKLNSKCVYENLSGAEELFPHIYGTINKEAVHNIVRLKRSSSGDFVLSE